MTFFYILLATLAAGLLSVLLAATVALTWLPRFADRMVAFAVGLLLTFTFTELLPEAMGMGLDPKQIGLALLGGLLAFFMLEKVTLWRHDHRHAQGLPCHTPRVSLIVIGDGLHNFVDGVLIAAAFVADPVLGWTTALAVSAHEIPQEMSDFMVLLSAGVSRKNALVLNALSGLAMVAGGVLGYIFLQQTQEIIPYVLAVSAASFIYVAVADLVPELHHKRQPADWLQQGVLLCMGLGTVLMIGELVPH